MGSPAVDTNIAAFRRIIHEIINDGAVELCEQLMAPDFTIHRYGLAATNALLGGARPAGAPAAGGNLAGFKRGLTALRAAFPDWSHTIKSVLGQDDWVAGIWTLKCTHRGDFMGLPPTGREISMDEAGFMRFRDGRMIEGWFLGDELSLVQQLGVQFVSPTAKQEPA